jgi:hypothetical protein
MLKTKNTGKSLRNEVTTMAEIKRQSPVRFKVSPTKSEVRDNWTVALEYDAEGQGPWLVDLAHKTRWDLQNSQVGELTPCEPGRAGRPGRMHLCRRHADQPHEPHPGVHLSSGRRQHRACLIFRAIPMSPNPRFSGPVRPQRFSRRRKADQPGLSGSGQNSTFLAAGPFCHVPCQIVTLEKSADGSGGFLLTCSRGYGDSMLHAVLEAGAEFGLRPAGENRFGSWIQGLQG